MGGKDFGYYPEPVSLRVDGIRIITLDNLAQKVAAVSRDIHRDGWIYAPPQLTRDISNGSTLECPFPSRVFQLPKTHRIYVDREGYPDGIEQFLIWCFGFFVGMRTTDSEAGFLDATPATPGCLSDFMCTKNELVIALAQSIEFYKKNYDRKHQKSNFTATEIFVSIVHAIWLSSGPHLLCFERFMYAYTALDACWRLYAMINMLQKDPQHEKRIPQLCEHLGISTPTWSVASQRNDTVHEGLFFGKPLGFSWYQDEDGGNVPLEMAHLASRVIVSLLEFSQSSYPVSPVGALVRYPLLDPISSIRLSNTKD